LKCLKGVDIGEVVTEQRVDEANADSIEEHAGGDAENYLFGDL
jgi:hypothetical protein